MRRHHSSPARLVLVFILATGSGLLRPAPLPAEPLTSSNVAFANQNRVDPTLSSDPDLEPGFPVYAVHTSGSSHSGPAIHTLVTNLDSDPELEIVVTALSRGPVYAWNHDGTSVPGWPVAVASAAYPAAGPILPGGATGVALGTFGGSIMVLDGAGVLQPGWPRTANYISTPPSLYAASSAPTGRVFIEQEDGFLHGYSETGGVLSGWPEGGDGGQERHTPAIGDIDGDQMPEVLTCSGSLSSGVLLFAYHLDGTSVPGFPVNVEPDGFALVDGFPVIGDLDGDAANEIVIVSLHRVRIYSGHGALLAEFPLTGSFGYTTAPALADLDRDGRLEIVIQTDVDLEAFRMDGTQLTGFPVAFGPGSWLGNSAPVIGDIDGDGLSDIAVVVATGGSGTGGDVHAYHADGTLVAGFPKALPLGPGAVPAIADIDLDGRNELVVTGAYWSGTPGSYPKTWAFDLHGAGYGPVEWGQFMHDAQHSATYVSPGPLGVPPVRPISTRLLAYPNPVSAGGALRFNAGSLPLAASATIFDAAGRLVRRRVDPRSPQGWDLRDDAGEHISSGIYFVRSAGQWTRVAVVGR